MNKFERQLQGRKRRRWWWGFLTLLCVGIGLCISVLMIPTGKGSDGQERRLIHDALTLWRARQDPFYIFNGRSRVNIVFLGRDRDYDNHGRVLNTWGRTDTILILALERDFTTNKADVALLSIPRDMLVRIPGHGLHKINAAHSFGGPDLTVRTLRESMGIHVDHYVVFKFEGFKKAVDAVGGVEIEVPQDMHYDDNWADLHIHLKKGWQHLDGAKAHGFVRFRHDRKGDLGRIERQHMLAKALAKKMMSPSMLRRLPNLTATLRECIETDMTDQQLASLAFLVRAAKLDALKTEILPSTWVSPFMVPQRRKAEEVLARVLGDTFDKTAWDIHVVTAPQRVARSVKKRRASDTASLPEPVNDQVIPAEGSPDMPPGSPESGPAQPVPPDSGTPPPSEAGSTPAGRTLPPPDMHQSPGASG
ncbi:MAG: LCP family protein [Abditibacteriales bacterium]|nr:LCP family protein [Abditibacteriales bacterium]MDW8364471.1 LCP family protein [Abditibacteriales bacterium]